MCKTAQLIADFFLAFAFGAPATSAPEPKTTRHATTLNVA